MQDFAKLSRFANETMRSALTPIAEALGIEAVNEVQDFFTPPQASGFEMSKLEDVLMFVETSQYLLEDCITKQFIPTRVRNREGSLSELPWITLIDSNLPFTC
mgnify:CR=1 FL=1